MTQSSFQARCVSTSETATEQAALETKSVTLAYEQHVIAKDLSVDIPHGKFTVIVGPNGCGKSTLLRSLSRLLVPKSGEILLNGENIHSQSTREVAKKLGLLPQSAIAPDGIKVIDLVSRGRFPHQKWFKPWSEADQTAVELAMQATGVLDFAEHNVDQLSGGQRQRVWVAMELMDLFQDLNRIQGHTLVAVLHDLNHACRYADHLIMIKSGEIIATGSPNDIITEALIKEVFGLSCLILPDPISNTPLIIPRGRAEK